MDWALGGASVRRDRWSWNVVACLMQDVMLSIAVAIEYCDPACIDYRDRLGDCGRLIHDS